VFGQIDSQQIASDGVGKSPTFPKVSFSNGTMRGAALPRRSHDAKTRRTIQSADSGLKSGSADVSGQKV
jgi:hypothetical protein